MSPTGDLGQNQQVVAAEALRCLRLPVRVAVDPEEGDIAARLSCNLIFPNRGFDGADPNAIVGFVVSRAAALRCGS